MNAPIPKAQVSDKDGEISCSVDETNRIRAQLGLKPLRIGSAADDGGEEETRKNREKAERDAKQAEILFRIEKAKKKRALHAKVEGKSLGESLSENNDVDDMSSWVAKSRKKEKDDVVIEKAKAARRMAMMDEIEEEEAAEAARRAALYSSSDLSGMQLKHNVDDFTDGKEVILTLADSRVLTEEGDDVAEGDDELENVNMSEADKKEERDLKKKHSTQGLQYSGIDDHEFDEFGNPTGTRSKPMLGQYDGDPELRKGVTLGSQGEVDARRLKAAAAIRARLSGSVDEDPSKLKTDLTIDKTKTAEEYYTAEEANKLFKKPKKKKKKKLRKKKKEEGLDIEAMEKEAMNQTKAESEGGDRGSRASGGAESRRKAVEAADQVTKQTAYDIALQKAAEQSKDRLGTVANPAGPGGGGGMVEEEDDDAFLRASLDRARRQAKKSQRDAAAGGVVDNGQRIKDELASRPVSMEVEEEQGEAAADGTVIKPEPGSSKGKGKAKGIVFTSTTEFSRRLGVRVVDLAEARSERVVKEEGERIKKEKKEKRVKEEDGDSMDLSGGGGSADGEAWVGEDGGGDAAMEEDEEEEDQNDGFAQPLASGALYTILMALFTMHYRWRKPP
jgi:U4/U6.U5 tri-snRNP-associated protein 1